MAGWWKRLSPTTKVALLGAVLAPSAPFWWPWKAHNDQNVPPSPGIIRFIGGCSPYVVYAENRWTPNDAIIRSGPDARRAMVHTYAGNEIITVDGWVHGIAPYTTNPPPWNSDIWFHLSDGSGWVSFAAVRGQLTTLDPTNNPLDGGPAAPTPPDCQGSAE